MSKKKTVLIVEDDSVLRVTLADALKNKFAVMESGSGEKALNDIIQNKPDVVVLDLLLPGLTGVDLLEQLRSNPDPKISGVKVVVLSNLTEQNLVEKVKSLSVSSYVTKANTTLEELIERIKDALKGITL